MLYPNYQSEAYVSCQGHLYRICTRESTGPKPSDFKLELEDASEGMMIDSDWVYAKHWVTCDQLRKKRFKLERRPPMVPRLPAAAA